MMVVVSAVALLGSVVLIWYEIFSGPPSVEKESRLRELIDSESLQVFHKFAIPVDGSPPYANPKTGTATLYPVELCYWTRDGKAKIEPTYVLLNQYVGKPGATICPDCGRRVVGHNPMPPIALINQAIEETKGGKK